MCKLIKIIIKYFLSKTSWRLKKIYRNKGYVHEKPNLENIISLFNAKGIIHMGAHRGGEAAVYDWFQKKTIWIFFFAGHQVGHTCTVIAASNAIFQTFVQF